MYHTIQDTEERERQLAYSGAVVAIESLLDYKYIKTEDISRVRKILEEHRSKIKIPDILESIKDSNYPDRQNDEAVN